MRLIFKYTPDPDIAHAGAAVARRPGVTLVALSTHLTPREHTLLLAELLTDRELTALHGQVAA